MSDKNLKNEFSEIFYVKEFNKLKGRNNNNLIVLVLILFLSYFALAFLQNYINELRESMDNPFTNWISLDIPNSKIDNAYDILQEFESKERLNEFGLDTVNHYNIQHIDGYNEISKKDLGKLRFRSIDYRSKLFKAILEENKLTIPQTKLNEECWVLINDKIYGKYISIPIIGTVKDLPDNCDVLVSEHMMALLQFDCATNQFEKNDNKNIHKLLLRDTVDKQQIVNKFEKFSQISVDNFFEEKVVINNFQHSWLSLSLSNFYSQESFHQFLISEDILPITTYQCNAHKPCSTNDPYYLTFNFTRLDEVSQLHKYLNREHSFEIPLHDIESKENFNKVANLAYSTSAIIIIISMCSVFLLLYHILESHIAKISQSIGTLKAFGLPNQQIIKSYTVICGKLFLLASFIALMALVVCQYISNLYIPLISLKSMTILLSWIFSFISIFIFCKVILNKMLHKTPGDLIYKR